MLHSIAPNAGSGKPIQNTETSKMTTPVKYERILKGQRIPSTETKFISMPRYFET